MNTKLYHFKLGLPADARTRFGMLNLSYTGHAIFAAANDLFGAISLPIRLDTRTAEVIEVETGPLGVTVKVVYRISHCSKYDLCLAVIPQSGVVKTVWLNSKTDTHKTLQEWRYSRPDDAEARKVA
jgi:hypothetical protein